MSEGHQTKVITRFRVLERIEHFILFLSFTTLSVTGLPQKFALNPISEAVIRFFGGIETTRIIHHTAAAIFLLEAVYHVIIVGYKLYVERKQASMLPGIKDGKDAYEWFFYNLGLKNKRPRMPRYNFMEKMEYLAMLWGLILMGLTGLMLWNPIATTNVLPGDFIPAAKSAHGAEAILAVLAIIIWHFYNVHIKHWNWGMIKGTITRHQMDEEHGQELDAIESGKLPAPPPPATARQRTLIFAPVALIATIAMVGVVYYFLTFENTAITTVPDAVSGPVYVPVTPTPVPPTPTPAPTPTQEPVAAVPAAPSTESVSFVNGIQSMLKDKCGTCHGAAAAGGFTVATYADVMKAVTANKPNDSKIVTLQEVGGHPGQLSSGDLTLLIDWIKAGAPEQAGGAATSGSTSGSTGATASGGDTWDGGIGELFTSKCGTCHGAAAAGGFTVTTYADAMKMISSGDPDNSKVVTVQKAGSHPGMFSATELDRVIAWIKAGAAK
jgi:cytochrome b subunit of formate dehydrogenase/mono/diheme cytochrome c family protein